MHDHPILPQILTTNQVAARFGLTTRQLQDLRLSGIGPPIMQRGLQVGYLLEDVQTFERQQIQVIIEAVLTTDRPLPLVRAIKQWIRSGAPSVDQTLEPAQLSPITSPPRTSSPLTEPLPAGNLRPEGANAPETAMATTIAEELNSIGFPVAELLDSPVTKDSIAGDKLIWYLIHTKPRQEQIALLNLERQGYVCYLPQMRIEKFRRRKVETVTEPMFPRYLFIHLDNEKNWSPIRSTLGVSQLVHFGNRPASADDRLVDLLRNREQSNATETLFNKGDAVLITEGPFVGIEAIYQTADAEHRSMILLEILSKPVPMRIDSASLRKVS